MGRRAVRPHLATLTQEVEPEVDCLLLMVICLSLLPCRRDRHHSRILAAAAEEEMATEAPEAREAQAHLDLDLALDLDLDLDLDLALATRGRAGQVAQAAVTLSFASCLADLLPHSRHKQSTFTGGKMPIGRHASR